MRKSLSVFLIASLIVGLSALAFGVLFHVIPGEKTVAAAVAQQNRLQGFPNVTDYYANLHDEAATLRHLIEGSKAHDQLALETLVELYSSNDWPITRQMFLYQREVFTLHTTSSYIYGRPEHFERIKQACRREAFDRLDCKNFLWKHRPIY